ncbi:MAG: hypothetical protein APR62_11745 [Smithella sp. SDB]|nr:MAG: hypothetical protein APR62_11745 [Smithella sp. SDB]
MFIKRVFQIKSHISRHNSNNLPVTSRQIIRLPKGFTLIEVIFSLLLVGVLALVGGMAIVQAVKGYTTVKDNSAISQKAQLAISRINREIIEMINIPTDATETYIPIRNINGDRIIGLDNGAVKIALSPATLTNGDILVDNVSDFTLKYYSRADYGTSATVVESTSWPATNDMATLTAIDVNLTLTSPVSGVAMPVFISRIVPRNNKNETGASLPPSTIPTIPASWGTHCFVATAAYGDSGHPMVQILRDFRDRYLLTWQGGRWLVKQYYQYGPAMADFIQNRPVAMWVARCMLAPIAALSFCLLYAPMAILFILLVSVILTETVFGFIRRRVSLSMSGIFNARGSILIGLIITMVIMAILGAAMLPMFTTSNMSQVYADQGRKVYYLAESGYRYAASAFLWAGESGRDTAMDDINGGAGSTGKTCNLLNNAGSFTTRIYPYWFKTQAASAGATTLSTSVHGSIPTEFTGSFSAGYIQVGTSNYHSYTSGSGSGSTITFSGLSPALSATAAGVVVQPVTYPASNQSLSKNGSLTLSSTGSGVFPTMNGNFILKGETYNYRQRTGTTLYNITKSDGTKNAAWTTAVSVTTTDKIVLDKFVKVYSTGKILDDSGSVLASREVIYNVPVGLIGSGSFTKQQDADYMNSSSNWAATSNSGAFGTSTIDGGSALKVNSTFSTGFWWTSSGDWAVAFFQGYVNTNMALSWMNGGGFLSYDLQVKVYNTNPDFFAGMNFRTVNNSDNSDLYAYGVSFIKPRAIEYGFGLIFCFWGPPDHLSNDIDSNLVPGGVSGPLFSGSLEDSGSLCLIGGSRYVYGLPAIILWKRTSSGNRWLAYRTLATADGIVTKSGDSWRLFNWSTLMVRVVEGYSLTFTAGKLGSTGLPIKEGDFIINQNGATARVVMTPILNAGSWATNTAAGTLVLSNISGTFSTGDSLYVNGVQATAGIYTTTKKNYIRVYFTRPTNLGTANAVETDNNRLANARNSINWPPDDLADLTAANDYVTLVQWTGYNTGVSAMTSTSEPSAIIVDNSLTSPTPACMTTSSFACTTADFVGPNGVIGAADGVTLTTSGAYATSTYYDDFAIQMDLSAGTGFLSPIQQ